MTLPQAKILPAAECSQVRTAGEAVSQYHIIVGESTPQVGGMCAHMNLLADGLAGAGNQVDVWSPDVTRLDLQAPHSRVQRTLGNFSIGDFKRTGKLLNRFAQPRRLLVYWVPHAYGHHAMNIPFCLWLWIRSGWRKDRIELMAQECFMPFVKASWRQNIVALMQRLMMVIALRSAKRVWVSLPWFEGQLKPYALGKDVSFLWLPVPSNIPVVNNPVEISAIRERFCERRVLLGHFGTFGRSIAELLERILPPMLETVDANLLLLGSGSLEFRARLLELHPELTGRIHALGFLSDEQLSSCLSACDAMIQPYPDGLTGRRGSALAPLAHGRPMVTNASEATEPLWVEQGAVLFAPLTAAGFSNAVLELCNNPAQAKRLGAAARETYLRYFHPNHMVEAIQASA